MDDDKPIVPPKSPPLVPPVQTSAPSAPPSKCAICNDQGGAFVWKETPQLDKKGQPQLDEKGQKLLPLQESVPCCAARAPETKPHEDWAMQKKVTEVWMKAARMGGGWPLGYEVTEEQFDKALHLAQHGVIR